MKNIEFSPYPISNKLKRELKKIKLTPEEIKEVRQRDVERVNKLEKQRKWQIETFGYYDPGAADY